MANKMALLTPPSTGHRVKDKENREIDPSSRVVFAKDDEIHILNPTTTKTNSAAVTPSKSSLKRKASKSILKKSSAFLSLPCPPESPQREVTPEPGDPLCDLAYLVYPVSRIIQPDNALISASNNKLKEVIEAYCILTARLKAALTGKSDLGDESWPLFQPLRKNKHVFADAVVRDLERATMDIGPVDREEAERDRRVLLPSPRNTPKKKKRDGLNEEEIKYARDMCTTVHAVLRFLGVAFTTPAVHQIFSDKQIRSMLTAVLAIPLAQELPSLNARKTCALAIGLLQTQRLPVPILAPAADRIAFALTRGVDGELGKEGKKGSASDGLKAVHDLSLHLPGLFVPAFGKAPHILLISVLNNLLAPTLTIRVQACHALGGYATACASLRGSQKHQAILDGISATVKDFVMTPSAQPASPQKNSGNDAATASPSKAEGTSSIFRTLRTTLQAVEPAHTAHGPIWALCTLAALVVLLGDELKKDLKLTKVMGAIMGLAMRHRRQSARGLACLVWRAFTWIYIGDDVDDDEDDDDEGPVSQGLKAKEALWNLAQSVVELENGVCTIASLLNSPLDFDPEEDEDVTLRRREDRLRKTLDVLDSMTIKDTATCGQALDVMKVMTGVQPGCSKWENRRVGLRNPARVAITDKDGGRPSLLPRGLFSAYPGLLTADWKSFTRDVNLAYEETWKADDIRCLDTIDFSLSSVPCHDEALGAWKGLWVWEGMMKPWKFILGNKTMWEKYESSNSGDDSGEGKAWKDGMWKDLVGVWGSMLGLCVASIRDADDLPDDIMASFVCQSAYDIIETVLQNQDLDLTVARKQSQSRNTTQKRNSKAAAAVEDHFTPSGLRLEFAMDLWTTMRDVMPTDSLKLAGGKLLMALMQNAEDFFSFTSTEDDIISAPTANASLEHWVSFCIDILGVCGVDEVRLFWGYKDDNGEASWHWNWNNEERRCVWRSFCQKWLDVVGDAGGEGAVALLAVPFAFETTFELTKDDVEAWQALLEHAMAKALDYGCNANVVLSSIATTVTAANQPPTSAPACIHLIEMILTYANETENQVSEVPETILELVNDAMRSAYPPTAAEKLRYLWVIRAVTRILGDCTGDAFIYALKGLSEAVALWVQDEYSAWDSGDLDFDIMPLYETVLVGLQGLSVATNVLESFGPVIVSPFLGRQAIQKPASELFQAFWDATYGIIEAPAGGWPVEIQTCLQFVYGADGSSEPEPVATTSAVELSPEVPIMFRPSTPTTPTRELPPSSPITPSRTRKHSVSFFSQLPPSSPYSPMTSRRPQTPRKTPHYTPGHDSPSKRRKLEDDKENASPASNYVFRPIVERIAMQSPCQRTSTLGKRRAYEEPAAERPSPLKKGRKPVEETVDDSEDEREAVADQLSSKPIPALFPEASLVASPTKKRRRSFFDAVEVPHLNDLYGGRLRPAVSFDSAIHIPQTPVHKRAMKPSHSATKAYTSSKRCSQTNVFLLPSSDETLSSDPIELRPTAKIIPLNLSSDDDPHIGQVTPHHLVSPEIQRGRTYNDCDFPSSDEPSPTKAVVERKLKRMASFTTLDNIVPKLGKVTSWTN